MCCVQVFPPGFCEIAPPGLELFDLDESFSSERARLAQLTNNCLHVHLLLLCVAHGCVGNDDDLEYFIREAGEILGVSGQIEQGKRDGKHILDFIFRKAC